MACLRLCLDPFLQSLDRTIGFRVLRWGRAICATDVGLVLFQPLPVGRAAVALAGQTVDEPGVVVGQNRPDPWQASPSLVAQQPDRDGPAIYLANDRAYTCAVNLVTNASPVEKSKLDAIESHALLMQTRRAILKGHKQSQIDDLLPLNNAATLGSERRFRRRSHEKIRLT